MKKLIGFLFFIIFIAVVSVGAALWYVQPTKVLDLSYARISVADKIADMAQRRSLEVRLNEADLNNLVKAALAAHPQLPNQVRITGAEAKQDGDQLTVNVDGLWREQIAFGITLTYRMSYRGPDLVMTMESARVKDFSIPPEWLTTPELRFNLRENLPKLIGIQGVRFEKNAVIIALKLQL